MCVEALTDLSGVVIDAVEDVATGVLDPIMGVASDIVMDVTGQSAILDQQRANADAQAQAILSSSLAAAQAAQAQAGAAAASINTQLRQEDVARQSAEKLGTVEAGPTVVQGADLIPKQVVRRRARFKVGPSA